MPQYNYIYFGDNANLPYGDKSKKEIRRLVVKAVKLLFKKNCFLIILACNTATANALRYIQKHVLPAHYPQRRVLGVIRPVVEHASSLSYGTIGIIGTSATVKSRSFIKELRKINYHVPVYQKACPLLVPLIEAGPTNQPAIRQILKNYLLPLKKKKISHLILGCTHYGLITDTVRKIMSTQTTVITESDITADKFRDYLLRHPEIERLIKKDRKRTYFVSQPSKKYKKLMGIFLHQNEGFSLKLRRATL